MLSATSRDSALGRPTIPQTSEQQISIFAPEEKIAMSEPAAEGALPEVIAPVVVLIMGQSEACPVLCVHV